MLIAPPSTVVEVAGPVEEWQAVEPSTDRPAHSWLTVRHAIKTVPMSRRHVLDAESDNSRWLADHVPTARPVLRADEGDWAWLVSERLPGVPAHRPDLHGDVGSLAEVAGTALRALHALSIDVAPASVERGWDALAAVAEATAAHGLSDVDEAYQRYEADELLSIWCAGRPPTEDLVICHGDPALPNLLAHRGVFTGFVDLGGVRIADRHFDLAHAHLSIHRNLGPEAVYVFYEAYGTDPDMLRLDHYVLAKQLLP